MANATVWIYKTKLNGHSKTKSILNEKFVYYKTSWILKKNYTSLEILSVLQTRQLILIIHLQANINTHNINFGNACSTSDHHDASDWNNIRHLKLLGYAFPKKDNFAFNQIVVNKNIAQTYVSILWKIFQSKRTWILSNRFYHWNLTFEQKVQYK